MAEWGIPNWRDPSSYGHVKKWSIKRWRWEFYRRRDDLRKYFDQSIEKAHREKAGVGLPDYIESVGDGKTPEDPGFVVGATVEAMEQFGYLAVPNPRIGHQPEEVIEPIDACDEWRFRVGSRSEDVGQQGVQFRCQAELVGGWLEGEEPWVLNATILDQVPLAPNEHEAAVLFDLNEPLQPQLKKAREVLRELQIRRHGKQLQRRRHPGKWLAYLRSLDAKAAGASDFEIAALHPHKRQTAQAAQEVIKAANALMHKL